MTNRQCGKTRETRSLNGPWACMPDAEDRGQRLGYQRVDFEYLDRVGAGYGERLWRKVEVPCCYTHCGPDMRRYVGVAWFRRSFPVPAHWRNKHVFIRFEALNFLSRIWVNDTLVTTNHDGLSRLDLKVDPYLKYGQDNTIIISTDNRERYDDRCPGKGLGYYLSGGIVGDVSLVATNKTYLEGARFVFAEPRRSGGVFALNSNVVNASGSASRIAVAVRIQDHSGRVFGSFTSSLHTVESGKSKVIRIDGSLEGVRPWSPRSPRLYQAEVTLTRDSRPVDRVMERFGFRKLEIRNKRIYLNGKEFFIKGITLHNGSGYYPSDSSAYEVAEIQDTVLTDNRLYYPAEPKYDLEILPHREALIRDLKLIKGLGCNYVRLGHFPRIAPELDVFDEMGILCSVENNLHWWQNDIASRFWRRHRITDRHVAAIRRHTTRQLKKMILRDMNHPSVACWVVSSECRPDKKGVVDTIKAALTMARRLDPSRFATHASAEWHSELGRDDFSLDDVISINSYNHDSNFWARELAALRKRYPHKPILVTEFGFSSPSIPFPLDPLRIVQAMGGYLAGFCLYVFSNSGPAQPYRRRPGHKGKIIRANYGLFDLRRKPVLLNACLPTDSNSGRRHATNRMTKAATYKRALQAYRVLPVHAVAPPPPQTKAASKRISAAAHLGLEAPPARGSATFRNSMTFRMGDKKT